MCGRWSAGSAPHAGTNDAWTLCATRAATPRMLPVPAMADAPGPVLPAVSTAAPTADAPHAVESTEASTAAWAVVAGQCQVSDDGLCIEAIPWSNGCTARLSQYSAITAHHTAFTAHHTRLTHVPSSSRRNVIRCSM